MRVLSRFLFVGMFIFLVAAVVSAQDPAPTPEPGPPQTASPNSYPDIDALREPGSSAKFLPSPSPSPSLGVPGQGPATAGGGRNNAPLENGQHHRNGRANDLLVDQADSDPLEVRVAYRRAKTIVMARDPELAALQREANAAATDVQKRAVLKTYYTRLFAEIRKVDRSPAMKSHVDLLSLVSQQRYDPQRRAVGGEEDIVRGGGGRRGRAQ